MIGAFPSQSIRESWRVFAKDFQNERAVIALAGRSNFPITSRHSLLVVGNGLTELRRVEDRFQTTQFLKDKLRVRVSLREDGLVLHRSIVWTGSVAGRPMRQHPTGGQVLHGIEI